MVTLGTSKDAHRIAPRDRLTRAFSVTGPRGPKREAPDKRAGINKQTRFHILGFAPSN